MPEMQLHDPVVSAKWLYSHLDNPNLIVLDGTINKVFDANLRQIPGARFFDIKNKFSDNSDPFPSAFPSKEQFQNEARALGIDKDSNLVVYDDKGIYSSARVWWMFKAFGHDNIAVLNGGFPEWQRLNLPTQSMKVYTGATGNFEASLQPNYMTFFKEVKSASDSKSHTIIDARSSERFNGLEEEPRKGLRKGTIPNSKNLPYTDLLDNGHLKDKVDIEKMLYMLASKEEDVIFSCGSGITACVLALGAVSAGYRNISVYDGSWTEWGTLVNN